MRRCFTTKKNFEEYCEVFIFYFKMFDSFLKDKGQWLYTFLLSCNKPGARKLLFQDQLIGPLKILYFEKGNFGKSVHCSMSTSVQIHSLHNFKLFILLQYRDFKLWTYCGKIVRQCLGTYCSHVICKYNVRTTVVVTPALNPSPHPSPSDTQELSHITRCLSTLPSILGQYPVMSTTVAFLLQLCSSIRPSPDKLHPIGDCDFHWCQN